MGNRIAPDKKTRSPKKTKVEIYGEEVIEKVAKQSGNSCRVYLPSSWAGHRVKIVRVS